MKGKRMGRRQGLVRTGNSYAEGGLVPRLACKAKATMSAWLPVMIQLWCPSGYS